MNRTLIITEAHPEITLFVNSAIYKAYKPYKNAQIAMNRPMMIEILNGLILKEVIPEDANDSIFLNEYFVLPLNLSLGEYSIYVCLNPTQETKPLINK